MDSVQEFLDELENIVANKIALQMVTDESSGRDLMRLLNTANKHGVKSTVMLNILRDYQKETEQNG